MSVIVSLCLHDGIVMGADSRITITYVDGKKSFRDGDQKIFIYRDFGILWCGNARVGKQRVKDYLDDLFGQLPDSCSLVLIADMINRDNKERAVGDPAYCYLGGYEKGEQTLYYIGDGQIVLKNVDPQTGNKSICIVWDGERAITQKIIRSSWKLDIGKGQLVDQSCIPQFTLNEGTQFARAILKKSCEIYEDCGEPIFTLNISSRGAEWIDRPTNEQGR